MKFDQMNKQSRKITSRENEKSLYLKFQYKGACTTYGKYGHKSKNFWHREGANLPKFYYCDKPEHAKKDWHKRIKEEKSSNYKNKDNKKKWNNYKMTNNEENDC